VGSGAPNGRAGGAQPTPSAANLDVFDPRNHVQGVPGLAQGAAADGRVLWLLVFLLGFGLARQRGPERPTPLRGCEGAEPRTRRGPTEGSSASAAPAVESRALSLRRFFLLSMRGGFFSSAGVGGWVGLFCLRPPHREQCAPLGGGALMVSKRSRSSETHSSNRLLTKAQT
jgi:hypothetical protein